MRTTLKFTCLLALFMYAGFFEAKAQMFLLQDITGRPIDQKQYENVNGSPYFTEEYDKGKVMLTNGNLYENVPLRYDLVADKLMFKSEKGQELEFTQPVLEFKLMEDQYVFRSGFAPVDNHTSASFYQVLAGEEESQAMLLKNTDRLIREEKAYGTANITKNIIEYANYYIAKNNQLTKVKSEKDVLAALGGKEEQLKEYIKNNKLKVKNEEDMAALVKYYNSL